jgi:putative polyhydroxyalkanoate system protein
MPKISISRNHSLTPAVIKQRLVDLGEKLQAKYQAKTSWDGEKTMNVKGPGVEGKLTIADSKVDVNLDLGFLLSPMKGKIEEALTKELEKVTAPESAS